MLHRIHAASTQREWEQALQVMHRVYVGEGHSAPERAAQFYQRDGLEKEGELLVAANKDGQVIGATLFLHEGSALRQMARPGEREFRLLAVHPDARGTGAGSALVQACIERARSAGAAGLVLWTRPVMEAAQRLYARLGFVRIPERDEQDPGGFTRLVFRRALP